MAPRSAMRENYGREMEIGLGLRVGLTQKALVITMKEQILKDAIWSALEEHEAKARLMASGILYWVVSLPPPSL